MNAKKLAIATIVLLSPFQLHAAAGGNGQGNGGKDTNGNGSVCPEPASIKNFGVEYGLHASIVADASDVSGKSLIYKITTPSITGAGLIEYCVYPENSNNVKTAYALYPNWDSEVKSDGSFSFSRDKGFNNIPFDGTEGRDVGKAEFDNVANPEGQKIILHINDAAACSAQYGENTETCWVYPTEKPEECTGDDCGDTPETFPELQGVKYYDSNANGQRDTEEALIAGWPISIIGNVGDPISLVTDANGVFKQSVNANSTYAVSETQAKSPWMQTGNSVNQAEDQGAEAVQNTTVLLNDMTYQVSVKGGVTTGLNFGNVCLGAGGGKTLGFWSNKNGQAKVGEDDLAMLRALNLRNADGTAFDPTSYTAFRKWILNATATNMAFMLSAQMAATSLNVLNELVKGNSLIYAPGTDEANAAGFATVNKVIEEANLSLGANWITTSSGPVRTKQEALKNALDDANNNLNFLQPTMATCPVPNF